MIKGAFRDRWIDRIRFADVIMPVQHDDSPVSIKITTCRKADRIEFHIPGRLEAMAGHLAAGHPFILKYSTEYAEVSAEWCIEAPRERRISTIIGIEMHLRGRARPMMRAALLDHLEDTVRQSRERIGDSFTIAQLDGDYFEETLAQTKGFTVQLADSTWHDVINCLTYRSRNDILATIDKLRNISSGPEDKYATAARLLEDYHGL